MRSTTVPVMHASGELRADGAAWLTPTHPRPGCRCGVLGACLCLPQVAQLGAPWPTGRELAQLIGGLR